MGRNDNVNTFLKKILDTKNPTNVGFSAVYS